MLLQPGSFKKTYRVRALDQETLADRRFWRSDPQPTLPKDPRSDGLEDEVRAILPVGFKC
jgi:hypothetical protein